MSHSFFETNLEKKLYPKKIILNAIFLQKLLSFTLRRKKSLANTLDFTKPCQPFNQPETFYRSRSRVSA